MSQITVRGLPEPLYEAIRDLARREGISLNRAAVKLLMKGAGLSLPGPSEPVIGDSLDHLFGVWSQDEADDFLESIERCERIDPELWR